MSKIHNTGTISPRYRRSWLDRTLGDPKYFSQSLRELGISEELIQLNLQNYEQALKNARKSIDYDIQHSDQEIFRRHRRALESTKGRKRAAFYSGGAIGSEWARRFKLWLNSLMGFEYKVIDTDQLKAHIPLFKLHSPPVKGAKVTFEETTSQKGEKSWLVTVFGTGMGAVQSFAVSYSIKFTSTNGDYKLIFIPVTLVASQVETYKDGVLAGRGVCVECKQMGANRYFRRGIESLPAEIYLQDLNRVDQDVEEIDLVRDTSQTPVISKSAWKTSRDIKSELGLEIFKTQVKLGYKISQERGISLTFELPPGRIYALKHLAEEFGLLWEILDAVKAERKMLDG